MNRQSILPGLILTADKFADRLKEAAGSDERPLVAVAADLPEYANTLEKYDILLDYMSSNDYNKVFENERYTVYH